MIGEERRREAKRGEKTKERQGEGENKGGMRERKIKKELKENIFFSWLIYYHTY